MTSNELGCDARGYSRAGADTMSWYCVVLAGRLSPELNSMRAVGFSLYWKTFLIHLLHDISCFLCYLILVIRRNYMCQQTMRSVQGILSDDVELNTGSEDTFLPAAVALKNKRLTFTWLDGETQKVSCSSFFSIKKHLFMLTSKSSS